MQGRIKIQQTFILKIVGHSRQRQKNRLSKPNLTALSEGQNKNQTNQNHSKSRGKASTQQNYEEGKFPINQNDSTKGGKLKAR